MRDIPPELFNRLYQVLSNCGPFVNDSTLRVVFSDARISSWRNKLPQANNPDERIKLTLDFLRTRYNTTQENALVLFLQVLSEQTDPGDACHHNLSELAVELEQRISSRQLETIAAGGEETEKTYLKLLALIRHHGWKYALGVVGIVLVIGLMTKTMHPPATLEPTVTSTLSSQLLTTVTSPLLTSLTPTPTATSTSTPTPTATPAPIFTANALYRVTVAEFYYDKEKVKPLDVDIPQWLTDDLNDNLEQAGLREDVDVQIVSDTIPEGQERDFAANIETDVLIWGRYDGGGIRLNILLGGRNAMATSNITGLTKKIPMGTSDEKMQELSFFAYDKLPSNATFLSMFVIGHLYYLSNNYAAGYVAFDAAMENIPETVELTNKALPHFFNARLMQTTTFTEPQGVICEYAKAIELDDQLFEAYNNLGAFMMSISQPKYGDTCSDIYDCYETSEYEQLSCIQSAKKIPSLQPAVLINKALQIQPDWALARFNLAALRWNVQQDSMREVIPEFEAVIELDPSIAGAYIPLGNMAVWDGNFEQAAEYYTVAQSLWPESAELVVNKGQALALAGQNDEAIAAYKQAVALAGPNSDAYREAHLALGNVYHRLGDLERASQEYNLLTETGNDSFDCTRALLQAKVEIDQDKLDSAVQRIEASPCSNNMLESYLLWLIRSVQAGQEADADITYIRLPLNLTYFWSLGWVNLLTLDDLLKKCAMPGEIDVIRLNTWGSEANPCLPSALPERIEAIYSIFHTYVHYRLFFNAEIAAGIGACPYIFTYDPQNDQWLSDTTILYKLIGPTAERLQARPLTRFDGRLWLRELEPETSYVNFLYVRILTKAGYWLTLMPKDSALVADDDHYLILNQGDYRLLEFDLPTTAMPVQQAWVVAKGYYLPHSEKASP